MHLQELSLLILDKEEGRNAPPGIEPIDLDEDDPLVADAALYSSLSEPDTLPPDCPFTFLYLSSQDSIKDDNLEDLEQLNSLPDGSRKQGTTHIPVTAEQGFTVRRRRAFQMDVCREKRT